MKLNFKMWKEALQVIPRMEKEQWNSLDTISRWLISTRFAVIVMTFLSACVAGLLVYKDGSYGMYGFKWVEFVMLCIGLVFAHAANNLINDVTDFKKGVDKDNYYRTQYGPQPIQQGLLSNLQVYKYIFFTGLIAVIAGLFLVVTHVWVDNKDIFIQLNTPALLLMLVGALFVLFYTWPLKYIGMGEICVLLIWGPLMIAGGYYVIRQNGVTWDQIIDVSLASLPVGLAATTVLFGKHIDKSAQDKAKGIYTLPVILGEKISRICVYIMFALQYLIVFYLVYTGYFSWGVLIVLLAVKNLIKPIRMYAKPRPLSPPADLPEGVWPLWFSAGAFIHTRLFEAMYVLGIIIDIIIRNINGAY